MTGTSNIVFQAGTAVYLEPGFTAEAGGPDTEFIASIGPMITSGNTFSGVAGTTFPATTLTALEGTSSGPFAWSGSFPSALGITGSGIITGTAPSTAGDYIATVTAADGSGGISLAQTINIVVQYGTTLSLSTSPASPVPGHPVTLTATVSRVGGSGSPSGTVGFFEATPSAPSGIYVSSAYTSLSAGSASATFATFYAAGDYLIASYSGDAYDGISSQTITTGSGSTPQTITFGSLSNVAFGTSPFAVSASSSSGLAVSFISATPSNCTISGNTVTLFAVGTCSITASQAGNATYAAATPVTQSFTITQVAQTITFVPPGTQSLSSTPPPLSARASSGLAVTFASTTTSVCTVSGATVTLITAGTCSITASQAGNSDYSAATPVSGSFTVTTLMVQSITFAPIDPQNLGTTPPALNPTAPSASSTLSVTLISNTTSVCTVSGYYVSLVATGTCSLTASQAGNSSYAAATPVTQTFTIEPACATALREYVRLGGTAIAIENSCPIP